MFVGVFFMVDVLCDNQQAIAELCARFRVARLDVFGSALATTSNQAGKHNIRSPKGCCAAAGRLRQLMCVTRRTTR